MGANFYPACWDASGLPRDFSTVSGASSVNTDSTGASPQELLSLAASATARGLSESFFQDLVRYLAEGFGATYTLVGELVSGEAKKINVLASWRNNARGRKFVYPLEGAPCENVVGSGTCWYVDGVAEKFPKDAGLAKNSIVSYVGTPLFASDGRPLGLLAVMDKNPRKDSADLRAFLAICANRAGVELERLQAKIRSEKSEHFADRIVETSPLIIYVYDLVDRKNVYANRQLAQQLGYSTEKITEMGSNFLEQIVHPEDLPRLPLAGYWSQSADQDILSTEYRVRSADGTWRWFLGTDAIFQRSDDGGVRQILGTALEITELKNARQALENSERNYRSLFEQADDGIFIASTDRRILEVNPAACRMLGYTSEELLTLRTDDMIAPENLRELPLRFPENEPEGFFIIERVLKRKDGSRFLAEVSARMLRDGRRQAIVRDIDGRRKLEAQLQQSQKMELVGRLAGGVAHDLNNMLQAITGFAAIAQSPESEDEGKESISEILSASARARDLTQQLLAFGRRQTLKLADTNLSELLERLLRMLRRLIGATVDLRFHPMESIGNVRCDRTQIEQVVMNLCINARDAMPNGGVVAITLSNTELAAEDLTSNENAKPGPFAQMRIADDGEGISRENLTRIFEPFFSTKEKNSGTGLGLSVVHGIVEQHGGIVKVTSNPGKGTVFDVFLPTVAPSEPSTRSPTRTEFPSGGHTALVAEDDAAVRALLVRVLERAEFNVLVARDGREALDTFQKHDGEIDVAVLDVMMPHMSGQEVLERVRITHPAIPIVLCSGYTKALAISADELSGNTALLRKPFETEELLNTIRQFVR